MLAPMTLTDFRPAALGLATRTLLGRVLGEVIRPADQTYDDARQVWNTAYDRYPALIVRAADAADVLRGVEFAREQDLPLAIRSGGHSFAGFGTVDGGVVLDLSRMKGISIDAARGTAWVQPGATTGDLAPQASRYGLTLPTGDVKSVGIGGLTLGGGIGFLVRKHGLTIDHLLSIELVTADGRLVTASADENSDLFWAVRGGGGNFGVVTAFEFRLAPVSTVYGGMMMLPATTEALAAYLDFSQRAPDELTTISSLMAAPPAPGIPAELHGKPVLVSLVCFDGDPEAGNLALEPLRKAAPVLAEKVGPMPYPALFEMTREGTRPGSSIGRSGFFLGLNEAGIRTMVEAAHAAPAGSHSMIQLRPLGGQMARVASNETAFAHRSASLMIAVTSGWAAPAEALPTRSRVLSTWEALQPQSRGVYVNFLGEEGTSRIREAYPGSTYERLVAVKRQYDPTNVFAINQNIHPGR